VPLFVSFGKQKKRHKIISILRERERGRGEKTMFDGLKSELAAFQE
jgi:hypothetical protein